MIGVADSCWQVVVVVDVRSCNRQVGEENADVTGYSLGVMELELDMMVVAVMGRIL